MSLKKVVACLKNNKAFLITSHTNVEGDALGSELSFYLLLKAMGKKAVIINEDYVPQEYDFLPKAKLIKKLNRSLYNSKFDVFVALDCSNLRRTGEVYRVNQEKKPILNIDHHISNNNFGAVNWVEHNASCCCELIYRLYKELKVPITKEAALLIYAGIVTDTGSFRYTNTSSFVHTVSAELLKHGIDVAGVYRKLYGNIPFSDIKLLITLLNKIRIEEKGKVVWFEIEKKILKRHGEVSIDLSDYILNFGRQVKDAELILLFKENLSRDNEVRVNFRSQGYVDVNKIAGLFGGGGHKTAASCTIHGSLLDARQKVLQEVRASLR